MQNRMEYTNSRLLSREKSASLPQIFTFEVDWKTNRNRTCIPDCLHIFFSFLSRCIWEKGVGVGVEDYAVSQNSEKSSNSSDNQLVFTKPDMDLSHCGLRGEKEIMHQFTNITTAPLSLLYFAVWSFGYHAQS